MLTKHEIKSFLVLNFLKSHVSSGKKQLSEMTLQKALSFLKKIKKEHPVGIVYSSVQIVKPLCEIKTLRIGASNYKVPVEIHPIRQRSLAIRFLVSNSFKRNERCASQRLAMEVFDSVSLSSQSLKNCDEFHKLAEVNKVYIQYRN